MMRTIALMLAGLLFASPAFAADTPDYAAGRAAVAAAGKATGSAERIRLQKEALRRFQAGCDKNDPESCEQVVMEGSLNQHFPAAERATRRNAAAEKAAALYDRACNSTSSARVTAQSNCFKLAYLVRGLRNSDSYYPENERTQGLPAYVAKAASELKVACVVGKSEMDCMGAAQLLKVSDPAEALKFNTALCDIDIRWACSDIGRFSPEQQKKLDAATKACAAKDAKSCREAGMLWYVSKAPESQNKALVLVRKGCDLRDSSACGLAGELMLKEKNAEANVAQILATLDKGCAIGGPDSTSSCKLAERVRAFVARKKAAAAKP